MSLSPTVLSDTAPRSFAGRFSPFQLIKRILPRGLFGRSLIIIVAPMVILQAIVTYVFFERDVDTTTRWMARDIAADAAFLVGLEESHLTTDRAARRALATRLLGYPVNFLPHQFVEPPTRRRHPSTIDAALDEVMAQQMGGGHEFQTLSDNKRIDIRIQVEGGVLQLLVPRNRITVVGPDIFVLWMAGSALILLAVAIVFLRNQVRPIERLARASEAFGKGRAVPDFKPYGASEVRRAARAFMTMRERIERQVQQRTEMLAGVSHDLKTPLTRMKLALAMMPDGADTQALRDDIVEMEHMLDEYLEFARGEGGEQAQVSDLGQIAQEAADAAAKARPGAGERLTLDLPRGITMSVRRQALKRCAVNLIDNALKHGIRVAVSVRREGRMAELIVEDNGPGIPETAREDAFRPFTRLDEGRNLQSGGVGLGLAIARDIARSHGGEIALDNSVLGGLRATVRLPV